MPFCRASTSSLPSLATLACACATLAHAPLSLLISASWTPARHARPRGVPALAGSGGPRSATLSVELPPAVFWALLLTGLYTFASRVL